jgi:hypothetical protein
MAGYSGTPLVKKLGVKEGFKIHAINAPAGYRRLLAPMPAGVQFASAPHAFTAAGFRRYQGVRGYRYLVGTETGRAQTAAAELALDA